MLDSVLHVWSPWMWPIAGTIVLGAPCFGIFLFASLSAIQRLPPGSPTVRWLLNLSPLIWPLGGLALWQLIALVAALPQV